MDRTPAEVERLVRDHWHLVAVTVRKAHPRLCASDREEVEATGYLALTQAAQNYDPARGASFATHAISRIRWATTEAALQCLAGAFAQKRMEKSADLACLPRLVPLDAPVPGKDGGDTRFTIADLIPDARQGAEQSVTDRDAQRALWQAVEEALPENHREVIRQHYRESKTFREIAETHGVSHQAVSQWHRIALQTLRGHLPESLTY